MGNLVTVIKEKLHLDQIAKRHQLRTLLLASALIVLISVNVIINIAALPVFAEERVLVCSQEEHSHSDACYKAVSCSDAERLWCVTNLHYHSADCSDDSGNLICGIADYVIHSHNEYCYDSDGKLVCALAGSCVEAHTHSAACYDGSGSLICTKTEARVHTHTEDCYEMQQTAPIIEKVLVCALPEITEGHKHTEACYTPNTEPSSTDLLLTCTLSEAEVHVHTDSCYENREISQPAVKVLSCTLPETKQHEHSESCVNADMPAEKTVLGCGLTEHTHGDGCYELKKASDSDTDTSADTGTVSTSDSVVYPSDVISDSDAFEQSEMSMLFNSLLISDAPMFFAARSNTAAETGSTLEYTIPGKATVDFTFTPEFSHGYKLAFTYSNGSNTVYIYDENDTRLTYLSSTSSTTLPLEGGKTYRLNIKNSYSADRVITITPTVADRDHSFVNGECGCGLKEAELGGSCGENASWSVKDGVLTITGSGAMTNFDNGKAPWNNIASSIKEVVIADGITSVGSGAFYGCSALESADIPDSVATIGSYAFYNCKSLADADLPDNLTSIGSNAFYGCSSLENVDIPDSVTSIGSSAFCGCSSLTSVDLPDNLSSISSSIFSGCTSLKSVDIPASVTSISGSAFYGCSALESVDIPNSVTSIGSSVFYGCSSLTSVDLPDNLSSISSSIFSGCSSLESVDIPESVTSIGGSAFYGCSSLTGIDLPDNLTSIGNSAFYGCKLLDNVVIPKGVTRIQYDTFRGCTSLKEITIPEGVTTIGDRAFYGCSTLESVDIPDTVTIMGSQVFASCTLLDNVVIPKDVKTIPSSAFSGCTSLKNIDIPDGVTSIGSSAFYGCTSLESIDIPDTVTTIGSEAFRNCILLDNVVIPDGVTTIQSSTFYGCKALKNIVLPDSVTAINYSAFYNCSSLESIDLPDNLTSMGSETFRNCTSLKSIDIPDGVTAVGTATFSNCTSLESADIPENATIIGSSAFYKCGSLANIDIPDNVATIGSEAFRDCALLESVEIPDSVTTIESSAFYNCDSLESVDIPGSVETIGSSAFNDCDSLKSVDMAEGVKTIKDSAFRNCDNLESVNIPDSVTTIGNYTFNNNPKINSLYMPESLTSIGSSTVAFSDGGEVYINSANLTSISTSATSNNKYVEKLTIGNKVDNIASSLANYIKSLPNVSRFDFVGENFITLETDLTVNGVDITIEAGDYFVDANGALYLIDKEKGTAELYYVPGDLAEYSVIVETAPDENGTVYPVTGVVSNALKHADSLNKLEFAAPEAIVSLPGGALANCPTLESVNGAGTVEEAYATFTNPDAVKADQVFYNTGLEENVTVTDKELAVFGNNTNLIPIVRVIAQKNDGKNNEDFADTYTYYTGEYEKVTIGISNADAGDYEVVRVYFAFDSDGGQLSWPFGSQSFESDKGVDYKIKTVKSDIDNVYYIECPRLNDGDTISAHLNTLYPSPTTGGGTMRVWPVVLTESELEKVGNGVVDPEICNEVEWVTKPDDFKLKKSHRSLNHGTCITGKDGETFVANLGYTINISRTGDTLQGMGKDHITSVDYTDTITLPEGLEWDEDVINAIRSDNVKVSISSGSSDSNIYIIVDGKSYLFANFSYSNYSTAPITKLSLDLTDDGKVQIKWTVRNEAVDKSELNNANYYITLRRGSIASYTLDSYVCYPTYINCADPKVGQEFVLHNDVDALQHFSYSEDQRDSAEVDYKLTVKSGDIRINKDYTYSSLYWGSYFTYYAKVWNESPYEVPGLAYVNDPLADEFYISPANIQRMFNEFLGKTDYLKEISIKITTATLCSDTADAHTPGATVTAADGTEHTLSQQNSGVGTLYHGCENPDPEEYSTDATLILTCTADGTQTLTYGDKVIDASDVHAALEAVGFVVTADVRYEPKWVFVDDYALQPGVRHDFYIYSTFKDSFMLLNDDEPHTREEITHIAPKNFASVWYEDSTGILVERNDDVRSFDFKRDFSIYKSAVINGDSMLTSVVDGDVVDYTLTVNHFGGGSYKILPLTDHMTGAQVVIVPAEGNEHLGTDYGLTAQEIDGESMYAINKVGIYNDVTIGGMIADSINVTAIDGGGLDTVIHWYLTDITNTSGTKTKNVVYKVLVDTKATGVDALTYSLTNETWLNDHQSHRLWSPVGFGDDGVITGTGVDFEKFIVTEKGATPDDDVLAIYEPFNEGEPTLYRLSIRSIGAEVTLKGDDIFDSLPQTFHDVLVWSKDNVTLRYEPAEGSSFEYTGVDSEDETWFIDSVPPDWAGITEHEDQQYIRWSSDMTFTVSGTLYIYVALQLPEGDEWLDNAIKYRETRLENSFYVLEEKKTVYHDLASVAEAYLQKGVLDTGTGSWNTSNQRCYRNRKTTDARQYFYNSTDISDQIITYYITVYNSGTTRLYLEPIQDALPKGVIPWTARYGQNFANSASSYYRQWTRGNVILTDENGGTIAPVWKDFDTKTSYNPETNVISFELSGGKLNYDSYFDKYYLAPNEGVKLVVPCFIDHSDYTEDYITNTVAMPYFDYLASGVAVSGDSVEINNSTCDTTGVEPNDGVCELMDTAQANLLGLEGGNIKTQWLASDVTLRRGEIVPGITKWIENLTTPGGATVAATETAGTDDTINWAVKLTDTGNADLSVWRFTDVMNPDYGFTGDVKLAYKDLNTTYNLKLFTIERNKDNLDDITLKYYNSYDSYNNNTPVSKKLERGGEAIEINVFLLRRYLGNNYEYIYSDILVRMYVDENGNEVLSFDILNPDIIIPAGGEVTVKLSTKIFGTWSNKVYYNNAYLTPLTQSYDATRVSQGNHLMFGANLDPTVRNSAQITAAYGYVTSSEKRIREIGNEANCASSKDQKNWIFLDEHADTFRYTNIVNNITGKPLSKFIMIDNLPEVGDHVTFAETEERYSAFKVELLDDPDFEVSINLEGTKTVLTSDQYAIMFSDRTEFLENDWDGTSDAGWYDTPTKSTRSFRLEIYDNTGLVIPDQASIHVEYNGRIIMAADYSNDDVTTDPEEGTIAWNSFGYHYSVLGENISLEAAPLKVGVCIQYVPLISKSLVYPDGTEYTAEKDETVRFILYSGTQVSSLNGKTEQEIANILRSNNRNVTVVDLTVEAGESKSDVLRLDDLMLMTYDSASGSWVETGAEWKFVDGQSFTVFEIDDTSDMYDVQSLATSLSGSYTSEYNGQLLTNILAVNVRKTWTVRINKTDDIEGKVLADATFGIYSPAQREQISDDDYNNLTLDHAPAKTIRHNGSTWYLSQVMTTGSGGAAIFSGLTENNYIVRELQAPGGYRLSKEIHEFALSDADSTLTVAKDVVNTADYELPKTGSADAAMMILIGNMMMMAAAAALMLRRYMPEIKGLWLRVKQDEQK